MYVKLFFLEGGYYLPLVEGNYHTRERIAPAYTTFVPLSDFIANTKSDQMSPLYLAKTKKNFHNPILNFTLHCTQISSKTPFNHAILWYTHHLYDFQHMRKKTTRGTRTIYFTNKYYSIHPSTSNKHTRKKLWAQSPTSIQLIPVYSYISP